ncbi:dinuclear metal center protein [Marinitoga sp. 1137]|uniref:Nif3-like dinuclear metal center hexameric protein n=1 Tax=Marinitoga sp. 1137 TaxID=1545835 RepID=UPI000950734A|nr:Nif3-like dinuclear metal center hexameric protein [Marinitoga sp. 1137]APT75728.1 dinuclear metal center protein [Marinitoga sp. 1137]
MANVFEIEKYLNELLEVEKFNDFCFNGIQIEGKSEVKKVAIGVSFNLEFIEKAIEENADMMFVHHGIFGKNFFKLRGYLKKRVELVIKNDMTLMGYHLPLDSHIEYGNNGQIAKRLNLKNIIPFDYGVIGEYEKEIPFSEFKEKMEEVFQRKDLFIYKNKEYVRKIAIISGGASYIIDALENTEVDTFITGEVKEHIRDIAKEIGINYINAGHYTTETFGVKAIGEILEKKFGLETIFIDVYNEI